MEIRVKDIYVAATLLSYGKNLIRLEREGKFFWFVFSSKSECEEIISMYWNDKGSIPPKKYAEAMRTLKDRLFSQ